MILPELTLLTDNTFSPSSEKKNPLLGTITEVTEYAPHRLVQSAFDKAVTLKAVLNRCGWTNKNLPVLDDIRLPYPLLAVPDVIVANPVATPEAESAPDVEAVQN